MTEIDRLLSDGATLEEVNSAKVSPGGFTCNADFSIGETTFPANTLITMDDAAVAFNEAIADERELDKELQRRPYSNDGENHD